MTSTALAVQPENGNPRAIDSAQLFSLCADDTRDTELWTEFLRRFTPKIKASIRGMLRSSSGNFTLGAFVLSGGIQEEDLVQSTIVRLVENDCAALRCFVGQSEADVLVYLAVITRSVVKDCLRRQRALKRPASQVSAREGIDFGQEGFFASCWDREIRNPERQILLQEIKEIGRSILKNARDQTVFDLYFREGLSPANIAKSEGIGLSKTGVEKILNRLKDRIRAVTSTGLGGAEGIVT